jgi:hypothetical protein
MSTLLAAAVLPAVAPERASAQLSIAPTVGVYIPTTELVKAVNGQSYQQSVSITVGGRVGINFGKRAGIVGTVTYAPSDLTLSATGVSTTRIRAG